MTRRAFHLLWVLLAVPLVVFMDIWLLYRQGNLPPSSAACHHSCDMSERMTGAFLPDGTPISVDMAKDMLLERYRQCISALEAERDSLRGERLHEVQTMFEEAKNTERMLLDLREMSKQSDIFYADAIAEVEDLKQQRREWLEEKTAMQDELLRCKEMHQDAIRRYETALNEKTEMLREYAVSKTATTSCILAYIFLDTACPKTSRRAACSRRRFPRRIKPLRLHRFAVHVVQTDTARMPVGSVGDGHLERSSSRDIQELQRRKGGVSGNMDTYGMPPFCPSFASQLKAAWLDHSSGSSLPTVAIGSGSPATCFPISVRTSTKTHIRPLLHCPISTTEDTRRDIRPNSRSAAIWHFLPCLKSWSIRLIGK